MCVRGIFLNFVILPIWNNFLVNHLEVDALSKDCTKRWWGPVRAVPGPWCQVKSSELEAANRSTKRLGCPYCEPLCLFTNVYVDLDRVGHGVCTEAYTISLTWAWTSARTSALSQIPQGPSTASPEPVCYLNQFLHTTHPLVTETSWSLFPHVFHPCWKHKCENSFLHIMLILVILAWILVLTRPAWLQLQEGKYHMSLHVRNPRAACLGLLICMLTRFIFYLYISDTTSYLVNHLKRPHRTVLHFRNKKCYKA